MALQKESHKLTSTLQKLKENINSHHQQQKTQLASIQEYMPGQQQNNLNKSNFQGPIKGLPSLNLANIEKDKQVQNAKIQIVQKQIVYTRTDSVKSNATNASAYPHTTQGGSTKVVRLIRGENDNTSMGDTTRTGAMNSFMKGVNTSTTSQGLVRKI